MSKSERKEFYDTISDLCNEGIFEIVPNGTVNNLRLGGNVASSAYKESDFYDAAAGDRYSAIFKYLENRTK